MPIDPLAPDLTQSEWGEIIKVFLVQLRLGLEGCLKPLSAEAAFNGPGANLSFAERTSYEPAIFHDRTHPFARASLIRELASTANLMMIIAGKPRASVVITRMKPAPGEYAQREVLSSLRWRPGG